MNSICGILFTDREVDALYSLFGYLDIQASHGEEGSDLYECSSPSEQAAMAAATDKLRRVLRKVEKRRRRRRPRTRE